MVAIPVSTFLGSPVSGAILDGLAGVGGLRGWQWLFIIEAVPAILLGLAVLVWLPDRPRDAAWLPEAERDWLERRLVQERQSFSRGPRQSVWQIMADRRVLVLGLVYAGSTATNYGLSFWQPQLIKGFGMSNTMAGVFNAIPLPDRFGGDDPMGPPLGHEKRAGLAHRNRPVRVGDRPGRLLVRLGQPYADAGGAQHRAGRLLRVERAVLGVVHRVAGGGVALVLFYAVGSAVLAAYIWRGRSVVAFTKTTLRRVLFNDILKVGAVGSISALQTNLTIAITTGMVGGAYGAEALAGYGTGVRLEYLLIPLVFGIGAPLVAMVGTSIGAGDQQRAMKVSVTGSVFAFAIAEVIGIGCAIWPRAWLSLFSHDAAMQTTGIAYLHAVGPFYGFFGLGLALYFASQGAGKLFWPLLAGMLRVLIAVGGAWYALHIHAPQIWVFLALGLAMLAYGAILASAIWSGAWFKASKAAS